MAILKSSGTGLFESFGLAAAVVVAGVVVTAALLRNQDNQQALELPTVPTFVGGATRAAGTSAAPALELATAAFAAGRITEPVEDNALHYYRLALAREPGNPEARRGLDDAVDYALNIGESALYYNRWQEAERITGQILRVVPANEAARALKLRAVQLRQVETLLDEANAHIVAGRIDSPRGFNAVSSYRKVLRLDTTHSQARTALRQLAQGFLTSAQTAVLEGDLEAGEALLSRARSISADIAGLDAAARSIRDARAAAEAAAAAAEARRLATTEATRADSENGLANTDDDAAPPAPDLAAAQEALAALLSNQAPEDEAAQSPQSEPEVSFRRLSPIRRFLPSYPEVLGSPVGKGWVEVGFTVAPSGRVVAAEVLDSSSEVFHREALTSMRRWRFRPYRVDGEATAVRSVIRFSFVP